MYNTTVIFGHVISFPTYLSIIPQQGITSFRIKYLTVLINGETQEDEIVVKCFDNIAEFAKNIKQGQFCLIQGELRSSMHETYRMHFIHAQTIRVIN